jgi:hypothetical protein
MKTYMRPCAHVKCNAPAIYPREKRLELKL